MVQKYYSHGKFLLTGEYLVLKGALALAVPLKLGQSLTVDTLCTPSLQWNAYKPDGPWFSATLNPENLEIIDSDDQSKAEKLKQILQAVKQLNPKAFEARWADVNPYELLKLTFGGSGYDIACATAEGPIYYQLSTTESALRPFDGPQGPQGPKVPEPVEGPTPMVEPIDFNPPFAEHLFFIYQGQKQSSSKEIKAFLAQANPIDLHKDIESVSEISRAVPKCESLDEFAMLMQCHERIIARCIGQEPVQKRFPDFEGVLKSLGAWGGDFILAATEWTENQVREYFKGKGLERV